MPAAHRGAALKPQRRARYFDFSPSWPGFRLESHNGGAGSIDLVTPDHVFGISGGAPHRIAFQAGESRRRWIDLEPGEIQIVPAAMPHWAEWPDARFRLLFVQPQAVTSLLGDENELARRRLRPQVRVRDRLLLELIEALRQHHERTDGALDPLYVESLSVALLVHVLQSHAVEADAPAARNHRIAPRVLAQLFDFIEARLGDEISVQMLAAVANLSCFHFIRAFRDETGMTPLRFVMLRRIQRAQRLLGDSSLSIADVAYTVGFRTPAHFSHAFRRLTGSTPRTFRDQVA